MAEVVAKTTPLDRVRQAAERIVSASGDYERHIAHDQCADALARLVLAMLNDPQRSQILPSVWYRQLDAIEQCDKELREAGDAK